MASCERLGVNSISTRDDEIAKLTLCDMAYNARVAGKRCGICVVEGIIVNVAGVTVERDVLKSLTVSERLISDRINILGNIELGEREASRKGTVADIRQLFGEVELGDARAGVESIVTYLCQC